MEDRTYSLISLGNPVLDLYIKLDTTDFFEKYGLTINIGNNVDAEAFESIKKDIKKNYNIISSPGGCTLNSARIYQWLEGGKNNTKFYGSIGEDENGFNIQNQLKKEGLETDLAVLPNSRTSVSLIFIYQTTRTIVFYTGGSRAGNEFLTADQEYIDRLRKSIFNTKILLVDSYFTFHSWSLAQSIFEECNSRDIATVFSIASEKVFKFGDVKKAVLPYVHSCRILVGNRQEFATLCRHLNLHSSHFHTLLVDVHRTTSFTLRNSSGWPDILKIIIVTDDDKPVSLYDGRELIRVQPPIIDASQIEDTTGAGDAFLAGFLWAYSKHKSMTRCLEIANFSAVEVIKKLGCGPPEKRPNFLE